MTNDEIRIAVGKLAGAMCRYCGGTGTRHRMSEEGYSRVRKVMIENQLDAPEAQPDLVCNGHCEIPNYPEDLNACREFEGNLTWREAGPYVFWLEELTNIGHMGGNAVREPLNDCALITASALHRCQAFLRLKGKWVEESK